MKKPELIIGDSSVDDRGEVRFVNGFGFPRVKRFYLVNNHRVGLIRAWHAHKNEEKYVTVVDGAAVVAAVPVDDWERPSKDATVYRFVLSMLKPAVLCIPAGYANGFMTLTQNAKVMFFSTSSLDESLSDDIRFDPHYWDAWAVPDR